MLFHAGFVLVWSSVSLVAASQVLLGIGLILVPLLVLTELSMASSGTA